MEPIKFGYIYTAENPSYEGLRAAVESAENWGFTTFYVGDHVGSRAAPFTCMAGAAFLSRTLTVGSLVLNNDLRHPLLVAHELASLHALTLGRAELGLGTGWRADDYRAVGRELEDPQTRRARLREAVRLIRASWRGEPSSFTGTHYSSLIPSLPRTGSEPTITVGARSPRMLQLAGQVADQVHIAPNLGRDFLAGPGAGTAPAIDVFAEHAEMVGRGFLHRSLKPRLSVTMLALNVVGGPLASASAQLDADVVGGRLVGSPWAVSGTPDGIARLLLNYRRQFGIGTYCVYDYSAEQVEAVIRIVRQREAAGPS